LIIFRQDGDVVLERVWDPEVFASHIGDTLMCVPIIYLRESLVNAVVEVFVVGEDDMAANIVELWNISPATMPLSLGKTTNPSGVTSVDARPPGVLFESMINHDAVS
jgi:hypothetical protein